MVDINLKMVGRDRSIFHDDILTNEAFLTREISESKFLVIGGAGTIGQAVCKEIFMRNPRSLHVVDISENNLVELTRDLRSSQGYIDGDFKTFALDCGSQEFMRMVDEFGPYEYILNLSALKHVRSEEDPYTLMRMIQVNILNTIATIDLAVSMGAKKYFCVSTDKAANPVNLMGASKRIMELFLASYSNVMNISTARFANVVFSDGSLLHGFNQRLQKKQPIVAPSDVKRYFVTPKEAGELCLLSCMLGDDGDIFFPKLTKSMDLKSFSDLAKIYLDSNGYQVHECDSENDARQNADEIISLGRWPCLFTVSDTTGEKPFEEFFTDSENPDFESYSGVGKVKIRSQKNDQNLAQFLDELNEIRKSNPWNKKTIVKLFKKHLPELSHVELGKSLSEKM